MNIMTIYWHRTLLHIYRYYFKFYLTGARSVHRDLETQIALVTINEKLRKKLLEEQQQLYNYGTPFTSEVASQPDRKPPFWVQTVLSFFKNFFWVRLINHNNPSL